MSRLPHGVVVGACGDEGGCWVEGAFVEEGVDCDDEEGGESSEERVVGVEDWEGWWGRGRHGGRDGVVDGVLMAEQADGLTVWSPKTVLEILCCDMRL